MEKKISLDDTVYEIVSQYPEATDIMVTLGFLDIVKPVMLNSVGRIMTLRKGSRMKDISLTTIEEKFRENGFIFKEVSQ